MSEEPNRGSWSRTRWTFAVGLGLAGLALNTLPVEILSGVYLLFGHVAVVTSAVFFGPAAGAVTGAIAGSITPSLFGHPWAWCVFTLEGAFVGHASRRVLPMTAAGAYWLLVCGPYFVALRSSYPVGTAATIVVKTVIEVLIAALLVQVVVLAPGVLPGARASLPAPLRQVSTQTAVRSVVLLAALLPLVILASVNAGFLYRERVAELDRDNQAIASALQAAIAEHVAEVQASVAVAAVRLRDPAADRAAVLAAPLIQSPVVREAALTEAGRVRAVVGLPRIDGATLRAVEYIPAGPPLRTLDPGGATEAFLLVTAPVEGGELVASVDPELLRHLITIPDRAGLQVLMLHGDQIVAGAEGAPPDERFRFAIEQASVGGTASYLGDPGSPRSLRPQATQRVAVSAPAPFGLRVVIAREQRVIQPRIENEAAALFAGLIFAVVVVVIAGFGLARLIVEPVRAVSNAASELEAGRRSARVAADAGNAPLELRQLAEDFDRMADELERRLVEVEQASRAKDEFLSVASHELKTPLTILKAQVQLLARRAGTDDQGPHLRLIDRQLDRITRLVSQLLDASAVGAGLIALEPRPLDLAALVRRVAQGLADSAPGRELRLDLEPAPGRWDELRLEQVLHNLVGNAIKYSPAGGPIEVSLRARSGGGAVIRIADRGVGLGDGTKEGLFERFGRGRPTTIGGLGVGLYVVREIVDRHGGRVELTPREGGGTVATVELPAEPPATSVRPEPDASGEGSGRT